MLWVVLIMSLIAIFQVPALLRQKQWGELLGFSALWVIATVFALLVVLDVPLPTLLEILDFVYGSVFQLVKFFSP